MPPAVTGNPSKDSQGPPGHISLADHITALLVWRTETGEEVWAPGAFLAKSQQGMQIFFFKCSSALPIPILLWSPLTSRISQPYLHL